MSNGNTIFFYALYMGLKDSFVSVHNTPFVTTYSFTLVDTAQNPTQQTIVELEISYSYTDHKNSYAKFELYMDGDFVLSGIRPVFAKTANKTIDKMSTAEQLELLARKCSEKVILQEIDAQSRHMLKTFINNTNIKIH